jgi:hypothetical protein
MSTNASWFLAAVITALVAVSVGATVVRMVPDTTIVDVAALLLTGFLAGLFAGFHLARPMATKGDSRSRAAWRGIR